MTRFGLLTVFLLLSLISCNSEDERADRLFQLKSPSVTGINFKNELTESPEFNIIEYLYFYNGAGVAIGDINNDSLPDLYFSSNQKSNRLYLNQGNFSFKDITEMAGVEGEGDWSTGVSMADVNGDGYLDIYQCQVSGYKGLKGRNQLFINNQDGTFTERGEEYGIGFAGLSTHSAWLDFDLDGDLDLYLLNHSVHSTRSYGQSSLRFETDPMAGDRFFENTLNEGTPGFRDISQEAGILGSQIGYGLGVGVSDINRDGYPDLYISNDFHENDYLYINNGDGSFTESLTSMIGHTSRFSMGNDIADINNDGLQDILSLDMLPDDEVILKTSESVDNWEINDIRVSFGYHPQYPRNNLQLNRGNGSFSEVGLLTGVFATDWSWASLIQDLDNDGQKDILITNGIFRRPNDTDYINYTSNAEVQQALQNGMSPEDMSLINRMPSIPLRNHLFRNKGNLIFEKNPDSWGMDELTFSNGVASGDLDNDGDLDLVINNLNDRAFVYENTTTAPSLKIRLKGSAMNPFGIGARIDAYLEDEHQQYEMYTSRGFLSSVEPVLILGMGNHPQIDSLTITWPGGKAQVMGPLSSGSITLNEKNALPRADKKQSPGIEELFDSSEHLPYKHIENPYNDYERESLIPHKLSSEGPCLSVADVNGDGLEDVFVGGGHYQQGRILLQMADGHFTEGDPTVFVQDRFAEDVASLFFDADGDNDPDLFVVSGGSELPLNDLNMQDRLYLNDGKGTFSRSKGLPAYYSNGSCIATTDWDGDGDADLFVGSRSIPGRYGLDPVHYFLENDGNGNFTIVATLDRGMITDALFADLDQDLDDDLVVAGEWMPVTLFRNEGSTSTFTEVDSSGLEQWSGWFFSLHAVDINNDGRTDLIAGNVGENNILKPSIEHPVKMYVNDFDTNGSVDPLITYYRGDREYPVATHAQLTSQLVYLKKQFNNSMDYAGKSVEEILSRSQLEQSLVKKAQTFSHLLLLNQGNLTFEVRPLPLMTQLAPLQDIAFTDVDQDGNQELILGYNFYPVSPYFGRYDAGTGDILLYDGRGNLTFMPSEEHNLDLKGDLRAMEMIRLGKKLSIISAYNNDSLRKQSFKVEIKNKTQLY